MTHSNVSRRNFLISSAIAGTTLAGVATSPQSLHAQPANNKPLRLAFIGSGGRGGANLKSMTNQNLVKVEVVALCDVNKQNLTNAAKNFPTARQYTDFRELYKQTDDIDGVVVSAPEHIHAYATMPALKQGKHVYCEKPLTLNVEESRRIMQVAGETKVATQMGTQIHGMPNYRRVVELIQSGAIGPVRECHVWVSRAWGLQTPEEAKAHRDIVSVTERPQEEVAPPEYLDWDLWIGPAPMRPFHPVYFPGPKWYRWWDFGNGTMSDLGSHWNDLPFWALKLDAPKTIEAFSDAPAHPELAPASLTAVYEYPQRGDLPPCKLTWHQGTHKPAIWKEKGIPQWGNGVLFIGDDGMLLSDYGKHLLLPEENFTNFKAPEPFLPVSPGQHEEWLLACINGTPTGSPFSTYAGLLTEANHLGNVAHRCGQKIEWDTNSLTAPNCPQADKYLRRTPREGYSL